MTQHEYVACYRPELTTSQLISRRQLDRVDQEYRSYRDDFWRQQKLDLERERVAIEREKVDLLRKNDGR